MQTTIYMMRHGGVDNPQGTLYERLPGFPLSQAGREQVVEMAEKIKSEKISICQIVSSPLVRASQTAQIIADYCHVPLRTDERLTEWGVGHWAGKPVQDFYEHSGYYRKPMVMDGLEPHEQAAARILSVVNELRRECAGRSSLIVSHRESMASAILKLQGVDYSRIHELEMPITSVWRLDFDDDRLLSAKLWSS